MNCFMEMDSMTKNDVNFILNVMNYAEEYGFLSNLEDADADYFYYVMHQLRDYGYGLE